MKWLRRLSDLERERLDVLAPVALCAVAVLGVSLDVIVRTF